jgi:aquaporin Z
MLGAAILGSRIADASVNYVVTVPGPSGVAAAFGAEVLISGLLMLVVLLVSNAPRLAPYTGVLAGILVALYVSVESPISGMSMNPARTFGSAYTGGIWTAFWIYLAAPLLGMMLASEWYLRRGRGVFCAKLVHRADQRCIFCESRVR